MKANLLRGMVAIATILIVALFSSCTKDESEFSGGLKPTPGPDPDKTIEFVEALDCNFTGFGQVNTDTIPMNYATTIMAQYKSGDSIHVDTTFVRTNTFGAERTGTSITDRTDFNTPQVTGNTFSFGGGAIVVNAVLGKETFVMNYKGFIVDVCEETRMDPTFAGAKIVETGNTGAGGSIELEVTLSYWDQYSGGDSVKITTPAFTVWESPKPVIITGARELPKLHKVLSQNFMYEAGKVKSEQSLKLYYEVTSNFGIDTLFIERETLSFLYYKNAQEQTLEELIFNLVSDTTEPGTTYNGETFLLDINGVTNRIESSYQETSFEVNEEITLQFSLVGKFVDINYDKTTTSAADPATEGGFNLYNATHNFKFQFEIVESYNGNFNIEQIIKIRSDEEILSARELKELHKVLSQNFTYEPLKVTSTQKLQLYYEVTTNLGVDTMFIERSTKSFLSYKNAPEQTLETLVFTLDSEDEDIVENGVNFSFVINGYNNIVETTYEKTSFEVTEDINLEFSLVGKFEDINYVETATSPATPSNADGFDIFDAAHRLDFTFKLIETTNGMFHIDQTIKIASNAMIGLEKISEVLSQAYVSDIEAKRIFSKDEEKFFSFSYERNFSMQTSDKLIVYKNDKDLSIVSFDPISNTFLSSADALNIKGDRNRFVQWFYFGTDEQGNNIKSKISADINDKASYSEEGFSFPLETLTPSFTAKISPDVIEGTYADVYDTYTYTVEYTAKVEANLETKSQEIEVRVLNFIIDPEKGRPEGVKASTAWIMDNKSDWHLSVNLVYELAYQNVEINQVTGEVVSSHVAKKIDCNETPNVMFAGTYGLITDKIYPAQIFTKDYTAKDWAVWSQLTICEGGNNVLINEPLSPSCPGESPVIGRYGNGIQILNQLAYKVLIPISLVSNPSSNIPREGEYLVYYF